MTFLENINLSAVRVPCGGSGGRPGALDLSGCARPGPKPGVRFTSGRSLWCNQWPKPLVQALKSAEMSEVRWTNPPQPLGANTAKSLTTRARAAALRLIGQPASRGSPRGRTHRGSEDFRCRVGLDRARFRLDPPGPGNQPGFVGPAMRAFRVAEAALGRATLLGLTLCLRLPADAGSLSEYFLTSVPRDGCGLPDRPPRRWSARFAQAKPFERVRRDLVGEPTSGISHWADMLPVAAADSVTGALNCLRARPTSRDFAITIVL